MVEAFIVSSDKKKETLTLVIIKVFSYNMFANQTKNCDTSLNMLMYRWVGGRRPEICQARGVRMHCYSPERIWPSCQQSDRLFLKLTVDLWVSVVWMTAVFITASQSGPVQRNEVYLPATWRRTQTLAPTLTRPSSHKASFRFLLNRFTLCSMSL